MSDLVDYTTRMLGGPGSFRFLVQPCMAILIGLRDGRRDSHRGRHPYFLLLLGLRGAERNREIRGGLRAIAVPLILGVVMSLVFQYIIVSRVRLLPALGFAALFVALPYLVARGLGNRVDSAWHRRHAKV